LPIKGSGDYLPNKGQSTHANYKHGEDNFEDLLTNNEILHFLEDKQIKAKIILTK